MINCSICNNTRHIYKDGVGWVRCDCINNIRVQRIMGRGNFPLPLLKVEPSDYKVTPIRKPLGIAIQKQIAELSIKGMYIFSNSSTRELAAAIITKFAIKRHSQIESASYITLDELTGRAFQTVKEEEDFPPEKVDILTISIGSEIVNSAHKSTLYNIIYNRLLNDRLTMIISSISHSSIKAVYGDKVSEILEGDYEFYEC